MNNKDNPKATNYLYCGLWALFIKIVSFKLIHLYSKQYNEMFFSGSNFDYFPDPFYSFHSKMEIKKKIKFVFVFRFWSLSLKFLRSAVSVAASASLSAAGMWLQNVLCVFFALCARRGESRAALVRMHAGNFAAIKRNVAINWQRRRNANKFHLVAR